MTQGSLDPENNKLEALRRWREDDHEDAILLTRNDVCEILDAIPRRKN